MKTLLSVAAISFAFAANAYDEVKPGDVSLDLNMCNDSCDKKLVEGDAMRQSCHDLCADVDHCKMNQSTDAALMADCIANANRKYDMAMKGMVAGGPGGGMDADANTIVGTDADNFNVDLGDENSKGIRDAR